MQPGRFAKIALVSLAAATTGTYSTGAAANDLIVKYDQAQLLRLPRPVSEVIIGNSSIADVTVQGGNTLVVTGKTFGVTNIIALDSEKNIIQDQRIVVQQDDQRIVSLTRGASRQSYSCTPNCSVTLTIGDDTAYFDNVKKSASAKVSFSTEGDSGGGGGGGSGGGGGGQ